MKKICISLMILLLMVACSNKNSINLDNLSPKEQYQAVQEKMKDMTSVELDISSEMRMNYNGEESAEQFNMNIKMADIDKNDKMSAHFNMQVTGNEMDMFIKDGYLYLEIMGIKIKNKMNDDMTNDAIQNSENNNNVDEFLSDIKSEKVGSDYVLTFNILDEEINKYIETFLNALGEVDNTKMEIHIDSITMTVDKDANIKQLKFNLQTITENYDEKTNLDLDIAIDYHNMNNTKVDFPEDLDEYIEY